MLNCRPRCRPPSFAFAPKMLEAARLTFILFYRWVSVCFPRRDPASTPAPPSSSIAGALALRARSFDAWARSDATLQVLANGSLTIRDTYILYVAYSCLFGMLILGGVFFGIERSAGAAPAFVDCLFHVASAMSSTGLITLDTSTLQAGSNVIIFFSMLVFANTLIVTQVPVVLRILRVRASRAACDAEAARLAAVKKQLDEETLKQARVAIREVARAGVDSVLELGRSDQFTMAPKAAAGSRPPLHQSMFTRGGQQKEPQAPPPTSDSGSERLPAIPTFPLAVTDFLAAEGAHEAHKRELDAFLERPDYCGYFWCFGLGIAYYFTIVFAGFVCFCAWGAASASARALLAKNATPTGSTSLPWFSAYHSLSLFTNTGMMMVADNMVQFGRDPFFVVTSGVIAALGFSYYPLGFRVFVRAVHAVLPSGSHKDAVGHLFAHPRKFTTHLFSEGGTWTLTVMSLATQAVLFAVYLGCDFDADYFMGLFPRADIRAMNGWFSSLMVYNAGFNTYDLSFMNQGEVVFIICCMWLTGRPFFLGILATKLEEDGSERAVQQRAYSHHHHEGSSQVVNTVEKTVRDDFIATLISDAWVCAFCLMLICFVDSGIIVNDVSGPTPSLGTQSYIGIVPVLFDLSSGYGNVGLSMGYPNTVTSSSAVLSPFSKLVVIFFMVHGCAWVAPPPPPPLPPPTQTTPASPPLPPPSHDADCMGIFPTCLVDLELPIGVDLGRPATSAAKNVEEDGKVAHAVLQKLNLLPNQKHNLEVRTLALLGLAAAETAVDATASSTELKGEQLDAMRELEALLESRELSSVAAAWLASRIEWKLFQQMADTVAEGARRRDSETLEKGQGSAGAGATVGRGSSAGMAPPNFFARGGGAR